MLFAIPRSVDPRGPVPVVSRVFLGTFLFPKTLTGHGWSGHVSRRSTSLQTDFGPRRSCGGPFGSLRHWGAPDSLSPYRILGVYTLELRVSRGFDSQKENLLRCAPSHGFVLLFR